MEHNIWVVWPSFQSFLTQMYDIYHAKTFNLDSNKNRYSKMLW